DGVPYRVDAFNAGVSTKLLDISGEFGFTNCRSAAWWSMRELLDPANGHYIALPKDDLLIGDLTAPHWHTGLGGRLQIESKDQVKKRLGRSTDCGDAVVMSFWKERVGKGDVVLEGARRQGQARHCIAQLRGSEGTRRHRDQRAGGGARCRC
ncbi:MAG: hypothetical protein ABSD48_20935, partial [Armatimonadota bacterium]